jgi:hypothetical protein
MCAHGLDAGDITTSGSSPRHSDSYESRSGTPSLLDLLFVIGGISAVFAFMPSFSISSVYHFTLPSARGCDGSVPSHTRAHHVITHLFRLIAVSCAVHA